MDRCVAVMIYPVVILGGLTASWALFRWTGTWTGVGLVVILAVAIALGRLERRWPFERSWAEDRTEEANDLFHTWVSTIGSGTLFQTLAFPAASALGGLLWSALGAELAPWPSTWPMPIQLLVALHVAELGGYASHRLLHSRWLFRFHALHHSPSRVYYLNAARNHPIDAVLSVAASTTPLALLGAGGEVMALLGALAGLHGLMQHANLDYRLGPLSSVLSVGEVHRFHHSRDLREAEANFGNILLVYDRLFGTLRVPDGRRPLELGLVSGAAPSTRILEQLVSPFRAACASSEDEPAQRLSPRPSRQP